MLKTQKFGHHCLNHFFSYRLIFSFLNFMNIQEARILSLFTGCFQWSIIDEPLTGTENLFFVQYIKAIVSKDVSSFWKKQWASNLIVWRKIYVAIGCALLFIWKFSKESTEKLWKSYFTDHEFFACHILKTLSMD